ncbi:hypothetical protein AC1031_012182 [Aphanomyces cochlioides]|nr:hypothetical protein AC1031_012182 [Aphanomyces cochlioides]
MRISSVLASAVAFLATLTSAHVEFVTPTAPSNSYSVNSIRVPHSFPGAKTINVTVDLPDGIVSVKPQQVYEWKVDFAYKNVQGTNVVSQVTWYGGNLPNELYQDFGIELQLSDLAVGKILYFPVTQVTVPNGTLAWNSTPDAAGKLADAAHPAPKLTVAAASKDD